MNLSMILAMDNNKLIGNKNELPWHLPADLQHFKSVTTGKIIVMGRKTFESIGRPLPNRTNIVITKDTNYNPEGVVIFNTIEDFLEYASNQENEVIIIGGSELIKQLYSHISTLYITHIKHEFKGDCYVKFIKEKELNLLEKENFYPDEDNPYFYSFLKYSK